MANVLVDENVLKGWAETIRAKTGTEDRMLPTVMLQKTQEEWGSGGGSSADVRYVTFMSENGAVEYGKIPVAVGYDCPDPKFDTPTKESTAQYNYTFAGWATTPNGGLDSNALKEVNEDRTVYANFAAVVRTYTITYYDEDGTTVLNTEKNVAYGTTLNYKPAKDGCTFNKWEPELTAVTGDMSYTAVWDKIVTFADGTWADIARISESGEADKYFSIGDTKIVSFGTTNITFEIAAFNHDDLSDGTGKAGITVIAKNLHTGMKKMHSSASTSGGWASCGMRTYLHNTLLPTAPEELQSVIKSVDKDYNLGGTSSTTVKKSSDKLWILSHTEAGVSGSCTVSLGTKYDTFDADYTGKSTSYWLRSVTTNKSYSSKEYLRVVVYGNNDISCSSAEANGNDFWDVQPTIRMGFCI